MYILKLELLIVAIVKELTEFFIFRKNQKSLGQPYYYFDIHCIFLINVNYPVDIANVPIPHASVSV